METWKDKLLKAISLLDEEMPMDKVEMCLLGEWTKIKPFAKRSRKL